MYICYTLEMLYDMRYLFHSPTLINTITEYLWQFLSICCCVSSICTFIFFSIWIFLLFCWYLLINSYRNCRSAYYVARLLIFYQFIVCIFSVCALHLLPSLLLFCCCFLFFCLFFSSLLMANTPRFLRVCRYVRHKKAQSHTHTHTYTYTRVHTLIETGRNYTLLI